MPLRNIKVKLNDHSYDDEDIVTDYMFVPTKFGNGEIKEILDKLIEQLHNGEISYHDLRNQVRDRLSEDVSPSSYKEVNFTIDFGNE